MRLKPIIQEKAKENLSISGGDRKSENAKSGSQISAKAIDTRVEIAKLAGVSHDTIDKTEKILTKGTPEQMERARKGGMRYD